jgi:phosphatidylethanolamine N-methyltransferase
MYGQRKPIAQRRPLFTPQITPDATAPLQRSPKPRIGLELDLSTTPNITEGETSELETDIETEIDEHYSPSASIHGNDDPSIGPVKRQRSPATLTQHDLMNMYFRKDTLIIRNVDLLRFVTLSSCSHSQRHSQF